MSDLICLSHLRWGFVYQRPQHLLSRFSRTGRVFFFEEAVLDDGDDRLEIHHEAESGVVVAVPHLRHGTSPAGAIELQRRFLDDLVRENEIRDFVLWYYTPMALAFSDHLRPSLTVYDCMDELSAFKFASPELKEREAELFRRADLVFTGGHTLYESKRTQHPDVHPFPSSVDVPHFAQARNELPQPPDQVAIPYPRIGYCGVIDERIDLDLLAAVARARPEWHLVMIGPVVKIEQDTLPRLPNIHYLGGKTYKELPAYMAGWDAAILPFAKNESTRFISPTKTPEYLAAGRPAVSTSIRDVVRPYGEKNLIHIADTAEEWVTAIDAAVKERTDREWLRRVDEQLQTNSWDTTWKQMSALMASRAARVSV